MSLPTIPHDKANHWVYGSVLASVGSLIAGPLFGLMLCAAFATAKEIRDFISKRGVPEAEDLVATLAGGATVVLPIMFGNLV